MREKEILLQLDKTQELKRMKATLQLIAKATTYMVCKQSEKQGPNTTSNLKNMELTEIISGTWRHDPPKDPI